MNAVSAIINVVFIGTIAITAIVLIVVLFLKLRTGPALRPRQDARKPSPSSPAASGLAPGLPARAMARALPTA